MNTCSYKIALGGVLASLGVFFLFLTGLAPFFTYLCPMAAGILLIAIVIEVSRGWAFAVYAAIAILSLFTTPDKEAALLFVFFFGHYPIVKSFLEQIHPHFLQFPAKFAVFNISVVSCYWLLMNAFGMADILSSLGDWGQYGVLLFLACANVVFWLYDVTVTNVVKIYISAFRSKYLRKIK